MTAKRTMIALLFTAASALTYAGGAYAATAVVEMPLGARAQPPAAYVEFCRTRPSECGLSGPDLERTLASNPFPSREPKDVWGEAFAQAKILQELKYRGASPTGQVEDIIMPGGEMQAGVDATMQGAAPLPPHELTDRPLNRDNKSPAGDKGCSNSGGLTPPASRAAPTTWSTGRSDASPQTHNADANGPSRIALTTSAPEFVPAPIAWTSASVRAVEDINRFVNHTIRPATDEEIYGVADFWTPPLTESRRAGEQPRYVYGDCEDYVLEKRHELIAAGFAPNNLSIAIVETQRGALHAVLLVRTTDGEFVLDNLNYWVVAWDHTPYRWVMRQFLGQSNDWRYIVQTGGQHPRSPTTVAALQN